MRMCVCVCVCWNGRMRSRRQGVSIMMRMRRRQPAVIREGSAWVRVHHVRVSPRGCVMEMGGMGHPANGWRRCRVDLFGCGRSGWRALHLWLVEIGVGHGRLPEFLQHVGVGIGDRGASGGCLAILRRRLVAVLDADGRCGELGRAVQREARRTGGGGGRRCRGGSGRSVGRCTVRMELPRGWQGANASRGCRRVGGRRRRDHGLGGRVWPGRGRRRLLGVGRGGHQAGLVPAAAALGQQRRWRRRRVAPLPLGRAGGGCRQREQRVRPRPGLGLGCGRRGRWRRGLAAGHRCHGGGITRGGRSGGRRSRGAVGGGRDGDRARVCGCFWSVGHAGSDEAACFLACFLVAAGCE
mmetsp:Transcript_10955/g.31409  ORF Transcript_10955/g.31409 Transcript_10955/m.31409 type:complete len:353 (-) Transcript_10955:86-1144(-)